MTAGPPSWEQSLERYTAFMTQHGRPPSVGSSDTGEVRLARWLNNQRRSLAESTSSTSAARRARMEQAIPHWSTMRRDRRPWDVRLAAYVEARSRLGCDPPPSAHAPGDRAVGLWIDQQRLQDQRGTLLPGRAAALDDANPTWRTRDALYTVRQARCAELAAFREENGRDPRRSEDPPLAKWLADMRVLERRGRLNEHVRERLDEINPAWRTPDSMRPTRTPNGLSRRPLG